MPDGVLVVDDEHYRHTRAHRLHLGAHVLEVPDDDLDAWFFHGDRVAHQIGRPEGQRQEGQNWNNDPGSAPRYVGAVSAPFNLLP